jgi:imidazoleglycerol-phosphate dehydratase
MMNTTKIALIYYPGASLLDAAALREVLQALHLNSGGQYSFETCGLDENCQTSSGIVLTADRLRPDLSAYQWVLLPGTPLAEQALNLTGLVQWLSSAAGAQLAAIGAGSALLADAGLISGLRAAASGETAALLSAREVNPVADSLVQDGNLLSARGSREALPLALRVCALIAGDETAQAVEKRLGILTPDQTRRGSISRTTRETSIKVDLYLDGSGKHEISTGVPFLDHMLTQIAVHGLFDLQIEAQGDVHIDTHHTVEDVGLSLGAAFREALGSKAGIYRMASFAVPMDESLARVTLDFSGRPYAVLNIQWNAPYVAGNIPSSLFEHFFESFAFEARCNLHIEVPYGRDDHHKAEAAFKALARALCAATRVDPRRAGNIPSSKGILM